MNKTPFRTLLHTNIEREGYIYRESDISLIYQIFQPLEREGRPFSYRKSNSKLPREAKCKDEIPPYTCMEGRVCAHQLAQLVCTMPEQGKENASARKSGRSTKKMADRPNTVPSDQYIWPVARKQGRWPQAMAGGLRSSQQTTSYP